MGVKVRIPDKAIKRFRHKVREILDPDTHSEATRAKIIALNQFTRGWCQYYRCTSSPARTFSVLENEIFWDMTHWLGRKYKMSMPEIMHKYRGKNGLEYKGTTLRSPNEYKAKRLMMKTWHNPYTAKEEIIREKMFFYENLWIGNESRQGWMDLREEVILLKGTTCYLCAQK